MLIMTAHHRSFLYHLLHLFYNNNCSKIYLSQLAVEKHMSSNFLLILFKIFNKNNSSWLQLLEINWNTIFTILSVKLRDSNSFMFYITMLHFMQLVLLSNNLKYIFLYFSFPFQNCYAFCGNICLSNWPKEKMVFFQEIWGWVWIMGVKYFVGVILTNFYTHKMKISLFSILLDT